MTDLDLTPRVSNGSVVWAGAEHLREWLVPIGDLRSTPSDYGDPDVAIAGLQRHGQVRPVLLGEDRVAVSRVHLLEAAVALGWTHIAARLAVGESVRESLDQLSLIDVAGGDVETVKALAAVGTAREVEDSEIEAIDERARDSSSEWVGLPEFIPVTDSFKLVISCETEADRDAALDALGIATIHKGTRGTLSVWFPDRAREDLSSLRFEVE